MGRTLQPFRHALEHELSTWNVFRGGLSTEDQKVFDKLLHFAKHHGDAGSLAARSILSEIMFISIAIEQEKELEELSTKLQQLEARIQNQEKR